MCSEKVGEAGRVAEQGLLHPSSSAGQANEIHPPTQERQRRCRMGDGGPCWARQPSLGAECCREGWGRGHQVSTNPRGGTVILYIQGFSICESAYSLSMLLLLLWLFEDTHRGVKNSSHLMHVFSAEVEQGDILPPCCISRAVNKCPFQSTQCHLPAFLAFLLISLFKNGSHAWLHG